VTAEVLDRRAVARWRNAIIVAFALGGITMSTWGPRLPSLRADLGIDNSFLGLILGGVTIGSIGGLVSSSALIGRLGARMAIRSTLWLVSAGVATIGLGAGMAHSVWLTTLGFVAVGFGIGAVDVMINVEGSAVERAAGRTLMPLMHAAWSAGVIIGSGIGAASAGLHIPFDWQFVGEAVLVAIAATIATGFIPVAAPQEGEKAPVADRIRAWLRGWTDLRLLLIGLVMLGVELGEGSANNWLTLGVRDGHGQPDAIAAAYFTVFAIGETAARVGGGPLVDRIGRVVAIRVTTAVGVIGLLFFILGGPAWLVLIGVVLWAVGVSMGFPLGMSAAADSGPNPAARVSVVASIGYVANLGGPPVVGALSEHVGLLNALFVIIILLVVGFFCAGALRPRTKITS
jgi:MFS family permease